MSVSKLYFEKLTQSIECDRKILKTRRDGSMTSRGNKVSINLATGLESCILRRHINLIKVAIGWRE